MTPRTLGLLNWAAHALLGVGLAAPTMTVVPRMEPIGGLARWLGLVDAPRTYSVLTGTLDLLRSGHLAVGAVLLVFSVLFPAAKLVLLRAALAEARRGRGRGPALALAERGAKYSMVDVFVVALLVVASKTFPGGTTVEVEWGLLAFGAAALLSVVVAAGGARQARAARR